MTTVRPRSDALAELLPAVAASNAHLPPPPLQCCCGREDCTFLFHSQTVLDNVEKDVHTAAKLGQALLARHEAYMADAERDRLDLAARIEKLEMDKRELQAENTRTVEENRALLDQLEALNATVQSSDVRIQTLEATLLSSQQTVRRLEGAAARAEEMERHVALLEREQLQLQNTLLTSESEARSTIQRWKKAERGILELQEQLERMEKEANDERERHAEAVGRMERQREVEKELNTAAGRLKGAAAAKSLDKGKSGNSVVSYFVKDLLQDNANLQLGMAELRELLTNSNDEIQALRDQLVSHQPTGNGDASTTSTLRAELEPSEAQAHRERQERAETPATRLSQEFHVHHHYHVSQKAEIRKPKKKRGGLPAGIFSSPGTSTPVGYGPWRFGSSPVAPAVLSHTQRDSISTLQGATSNRWSLFSEQPSEFAASSVPSSPPSVHRYPMFDKPGDVDAPSSPTTSEYPMSPTFRGAHLKRPSEVSNRSVSMPTHIMSTPITPSTESSRPLPPEPILEENREEDTDTEVPEIITPANDTSPEDPSMSGYDGLSRPRLHRVCSHESIMSLTGGLDIHTLKARPSQLTLRPLGGADAVFTGVTASSTIAKVTTKRSSAVLRDSLANLPTPATPTRSLSPSSSIGDRTSKIGRWVQWRPWGAGNGGSSSPIPDDDTASVGKSERERLIHRASGINQPGSIPGFQEYLSSHQRRGAPSKVSPDQVDVDALREVLED